MARNNETITLKINVSGNGNLEIKQMNEKLEETSKKGNKASKSVNNIGESAIKSTKKVSDLSVSFSSLSKIVAGISLGALATDLYRTNEEWSRLNAIMKATSKNSEKVKRDFEIIKNFKGITYFDPQDIAESYNLLRSQNIKFSKDLLNTITGTAIATNQNIVTVTEQFRAVLNGEEATLDDYFKAVTKTTDGILVQYTTAEGKLKTKLLKTAEDTAEAMKEQFGSVNKSLEDTFSQTARIFKERISNRILKDLKIFAKTYIEEFNKITKKREEEYLKQNNLQPAKVNKFLLEDTDVKAGEKIIEKNKEIEQSNKELADSVKTVNALTSQYQETISDTKSLEELNNATVKYYDTLKQKGLKLQDEVLKRQSKEFEKQLKVIEKNNKEKLNKKIEEINREIEILKAGKEKEFLLLEEAKQKELESVKNPKLIQAINDKYEVEYNLLKDKLEKEKQLKEQQTLSSIDSRISALGESPIDLTQGMTQEEQNQKKLEEINTFYDEKISILEEKLNLEILTKEQFAQTEIELERAKADKILAIRKQVEDSKKQELSNIATGLEGIASIFQSFDTVMGKQSKGSFEAQKAFAIASATINAYLGASKALAEGGPVLGPIMAGVQLASGLAQVAQISSQTYQPKYHDGGLVTNNGSLSNEVDATLQTGEGVLSRRGMSALDKLNRGETTTNGNVEVIIVNNMEEALERQLNSRSGRSLIKEISNS